MKGFSFLVESKAARISEAYSQRMNISLEEAIVMFLRSKTYHVLNDVETGVYLEVFEFVYDMFLEEVGELSDEQNYFD